MKLFLIFLFPIIFFSCNSQKKEGNPIIEKTFTDEYPIAKNIYTDENSIIKNVYTDESLTFKELKAEFLNSINLLDDFPIGANFWDRFDEYKTQFNLTDNESKLLGTWMNIAFYTEPYQTFTFFPNKFFIINFNNEYFKLIENENIFYNGVFGTWEIIDDFVRITIYTISIEDTEKEFNNNKDVSLIVYPYSVDLINIDDISEEGFTKQPINDTILSEELQNKVIVTEPNIFKNLYVRNVYTIGYGSVILHFSYFVRFPDMTRENRSGLEIATDPKLIKKYIPDWMF